MQARVVEGPDPLWQYVQFGKTKCTATIRPKICRVTKVFPELDAWTDLFARFVEAKGKVEPNKYRAFWLQNAWSFASRCHARVAGHPYALRKSAYAFFTSETKTARVEP